MRTLITIMLLIGIAGFLMIVFGAATDTTRTQGRPDRLPLSFRLDADANEAARARAANASTARDMANALACQSFFDRKAQVCVMYVAQQGARTAYCALSFFDADGTFLEQGLFGEVTLKRVRLDGTPYRLALETIRARDDSDMAVCEGTFTR